MSYIQFDKTKLINLKYSLSREVLRTNRAGSYASSTIINVNTRKYHGLLIVPQPLIDDQNHVLLSTLDETLVANDSEFHLSARMFPGGIVSPKGHKYIRDFQSHPNLGLTYRLGQIVLSKEYIFSKNEDRILIKYKLEDSLEPVTLKISPFLAYRNVNSLSKANTNVDTSYKEVQNGASWQMYQGYSRIYMQFSQNVEYTHTPDWHYNIEYIREMERGYPYIEDLFVPGFFEILMKKGDTLVISVGLEEKNPTTFKRQFSSEIKKRTPRDNFEHCLINAAEEFIIKSNKKTNIIAGYPWFGVWGRDTFITLPGLALTRNDEKSFKEVIKTMLASLKDGLFPNIMHGQEAVYNTVDASLWFIWALQQYTIMTDKGNTVWKDYGKYIKQILEAFKSGTNLSIKMHDNGLIWAGEKGKAITWMDAVVNGKPVTPRTGYNVEVNALWYNAIKFSLELAKNAEDKEFVNNWKEIPELTKNNFNLMFWDNDKGYLADYVDDENKNWDVRPNQIFAVSMPYSMLDDSQKYQVVDKVKSELLTTRGLRTLSPKNPNYKGRYFGDQNTRDSACHQGVVWPWLLGAYAEAYLKIYNSENDKEHVRSLYKGFEEEMNQAGIGTISEVYDGDPPHNPGGAISQAWSVSELLRIKWLLDGNIED
jgi:predicted glycogen debranching enzyme